MRSIAPVLGLCLLPACAPTAPPRAAACGALPPRIVAAAQSYQGVERAKLRVDADGALAKISLYHGDASKVPASVVSVTREQLPGATIRSYELELYRDDGWVHEVEVTKADGTACEVAVLETGALHYVECHSPPADLSEPMVSAIRARVPGAEILAVETKRGPDVDVVAVDATAGGVEHAFHFDGAGALVGHWVKLPAVLELPARR